MLGLGRSAALCSSTSTSTSYSSSTTSSTSSSRLCAPLQLSLPPSPLLLPLPQPFQQQQQQRSCMCYAKRGRPSKRDASEQGAAADSDASTTSVSGVEAAEPAPAAAKRKGRKRKTEVEPAPTTAEAPLSAEMQTVVAHDHERVISIEDMTSSVELDYTDNPTLIVPSYTHQAQGHESATQPPLDNYVPYADSPVGFVGSEELPPSQQQQQQSAAAAGGSQLPTPFQQLAASLQPQEQQQQAQLWPPPAPSQQQQQVVGVDGLAPAAAAGVGGVDEEEDDELLGYDDPPGLFDYEAGLPFAVTQPPPERPLQSVPAQLRAKSRREADYLLRYISYLGDIERVDKEVAYKEQALAYHLAQVKESHNVYLTGKALSVVMAEIEAEDVQTANRTDSFYPIWARAEHRWYPSGRFAAYNEYVKENLPDLTVKYAPGADQEEDFDIMDDVLLMADDPNMPGGAGAGGGDEADESIGNPAAGLSIDSFMGASMLPGAGSSELGQAYLDDVLAPAGAGDEELEEELME